MVLKILRFLGFPKVLSSFTVFWGFVYTKLFPILFYHRIHSTKQVWDYSAKLFFPDGQNFNFFMKYFFMDPREPIRGQFARFVFFSFLSLLYFLRYTNKVNCVKFILSYVLSWFWYRWTGNKISKKIRIFLLFFAIHLV